MLRKKQDRNEPIPPLTSAERRERRRERRDWWAFWAQIFIAATNAALVAEVYAHVAQEYAREIMHYLFF